MTTSQSFIAVVYPTLMLAMTKKLEVGGHHTCSQLILQGRSTTYCALHLAIKIQV